jgi:hypothetical protein
MALTEYKLDLTREGKNTLVNGRQCSFNRPPPSLYKKSSNVIPEAQRLNRQTLRLSNHTVLKEGICCGARSNDCIVLLPRPIREGRTWKRGGRQQQVISYVFLYSLQYLQALLFELCYSFSVWSPYPSFYSMCLR